MSKKSKRHRNKKINMSRQLENFSKISMEQSPEQNQFMKLLKQQAHAKCHGDKCLTTEENEDYKSIEYLRYNSPVLSYVIHQMIIFMMYKPLIADKADSDETRILENFLNSKNIKGQTNQSVLLSAFFETMIYGRTGLRYLSKKDGWVNVDYDKYSVIVGSNIDYPTIDTVLGYFVYRLRQNRALVRYEDKIDGLFNFEDFQSFITVNEMNADMDDDYYMELISPSDFINLRWDPKEFIPKSPLAYDSLRQEVILKFYQSIVDKLNERGIGRNIVEMNEEYSKIVLAQGELANFAKDSQDKFNKNLKDLSEKFANDIKFSSADEVFVVPPMFKNFQNFENMADPSKFIKLFEFEYNVYPQIYGIPNTLLGFGLSDRNVSIASVNKTAELTTIENLRQRFITQIKPMLMEKLSLSDVKIDTNHVNDPTDNINNNKTIAETIQLLVKAGLEEEAKAYAANYLN